MVYHGDIKTVLSLPLQNPSYVQIVPEQYSRRTPIPLPCRGAHVAIKLVQVMQEHSFTQSLSWLDSAFQTSSGVTILLPLCILLGTCRAAPPAQAQTSCARARAVMFELSSSLTKLSTDLYMMFQRIEVCRLSIAGRLT
jgi:hypothetical protein